MESHRRAGYYEFKAYTEPLANGMHQGFVLVCQHTFAGIQQSVFRAGRPRLQKRMPLPWPKRESPISSY